MTQERSTPAEATEPLLGDHARLETLLAAVRLACDSGALDAARAASQRLLDGLERHLDREERLYFPAIGALRPGHRALLDRLVGAHARLRSRSRELAAHLAAERLEAGRGTLAHLATAFADHEAEEEAFLDGLEAELGDRA